MRIPRLFLGLVFGLGVLCAPSHGANAPTSAPALTLEQIMADPEWIGNRPEEPFISADSRLAYFLRKEPGSELRRLWRVPLAGGPMEKLSPAEVAQAESADRVFTPDRQRAAWVRAGNVFVRTEAGPRQLTRTGDATEMLTFVGRDRVAYWAGERLFAVDLGSGTPALLATLRVIDDPDLPKTPKDVLAEGEARLFDTVKQREARRLEKAAMDRELAQQAASAPRPIYFGKDKAVRTVSLSPDGERLLVGITAAELRGRRDRMAAYVNADGYMEPTDVRATVGTDKPLDETLYLVDLTKGTKRKLTLGELPGIDQDPLAEMRQAAAARKKAKAEAAKKEAAKAGGDEAADEGKAADAAKSGKDNGAADDAKPADAAKSKLRAGYVSGEGRTGVRWSADGRRVAVNLFAYDNKDRWLAEIDWPAGAARGLHRLTDAAWVADVAFNEFGWLPDNAGFWFTSEESGYSHLYVRRGTETRALTAGKFEVNSVQLDPKDGWFYYRANRRHPGNHEVHRVRFDGASDEAVTALGGGSTYELSPDGRQVLLVHSTLTRPPELFGQAARPGAPATRLTTTVSDAFARIAWLEPEIVPVPSRAGGAPVYSLVYRDAAARSGPARPAVMFVHGAGYLQNAHHGWSLNYFREFMFHQLLVGQGFVVIDMDYRGSAGYGRDWRTAIYRRMGTPELDDYLDGIEWLVANANVDRRRIGMYGGSYGGFLTLMALFKAPEVLAAGAALRPVTDWAHYNHTYTSNILNTPELDPEAYLQSSPIEYAAGLQRPLLISSGMLDDNVFFKDSVRLVQRLIELRKDSFELAVFPVEPHAFRDPVSWLNQYRRVFRLMEREVKQRPDGGGRR